MDVYNKTVLQNKFQQLAGAMLIAQINLGKAALWLTITALMVTFFV